MAGSKALATLRRVTSSRRSDGQRPLAARARTRADHLQRVHRVLVHIGTRLDADLSLERLARLAHLSPHHFQRVFALIAGESCKRHVHRLRLERAARALRDTDHDIAAIAEDSTYCDVPSFYRAFHAHFATSPARFRERAARRRPAAGQPASVRRWQVRTDADGQLSSVPLPADTARSDAGPAVRIVVLAPLRIAFVRRTGPVAPRAVAADFARLVAFASRRNPVTEPLLVRLHHDDQEVTPARLRRTDHGITIGPRRRGEGDIGIQKIGGDEMLVATCNGGPASVVAVRRWLERERIAAAGGVRGNGPVLEILLDGAPAASTRASALRDVLVPVALPATTHPWYWRRRPAPNAAPPLPVSP